VLMSVVDIRGVTVTMDERSMFLWVTVEFA
jgi:hypothetical protein